MWVATQPYPQFQSTKAMPDVANFVAQQFGIAHLLICPGAVKPNLASTLPVRCCFHDTQQSREQRTVSETGYSDRTKPDGGIPSHVNHH